MSGRGWLRAGLGLPAGAQLVLGLWVLVLPELFWKWPWVSHLPPCNEHPLRDLGGASLALAVVLCAAVAAMERRLVLTAPVAHLVNSVAISCSTPGTWSPCRQGAPPGSWRCWGSGCCCPRH
ncbi:hypothetical protein ACFW4M_12055 [Streptomyces sp. NPDC058794]|uniref:hypothetical protein n=1 Tax=unclassified Streptomyces TaxID=2593676 RepID=UPI0036D113DD